MNNIQHGTKKLSADTDTNCNGKQSSTMLRKHASTNVGRQWGSAISLQVLKSARWQPYIQMHPNCKGSEFRISAGLTCSLWCKQPETR